MLRYSFFLLILFPAYLPCSSFSAENLDQAGIHKLYENGEFEKVIERIDSYRKSSLSYSHSDSAFIAKHLAVVYTANSQTVEVGKHWMYELLKLIPNADLAGMYVNEYIDHIFDKVKRELTARQLQPSGNATTEAKSTLINEKPGPIQYQTSRKENTESGNKSDPVSAQTRAGDCRPACRSGFACLEGQCVSACNPQCGDGEICVGKGVCKRQKLTAGPRRYELGLEGGYLGIGGHDDPDYRDMDYNAPGLVRLGGGIFFRFLWKEQPDRQGWLALRLGMEFPRYALDGSITEEPEPMVSLSQVIRFPLAPPGGLLDSKSSLELGAGGYGLFGKNEGEGGILLETRFNFLWFQLGTTMTLGVETGIAFGCLVGGHLDL